MNEGACSKNTVRVRVSLVQGNDTTDVSVEATIESTHDANGHGKLRILAKPLENVAVWVRPFFAILGMKWFKNSDILQGIWQAKELNIKNASAAMKSVKSKLTVEQLKKLKAPLEELKTILSFL